MPNTISMPMELYEWDGELYSAFYNNVGGNNVGGVIKLKASDGSFIKAVKSPEMKEPKNIAVWNSCSNVSKVVLRVQD